MRIRLIIVAIAVGLVGCSPTASTDSRDVNCWDAPGEGAVHRISFGESTAELWILTGPVVEANRLTRLDSGGATSLSVNLPPGALDALAIDDEGRPMWVADDGTASRLWRLEDGQAVAVGVLPSPRIARLYWIDSGADPGLAVLTWTLEDPDLAFVAHVEFAADSTTFIVPWAYTGLIDAAVARDGSIAMTRRTARTFELVTGSGSRLPVSVDLGNLAIAEGGAPVLFEAGSAEVKRWDPATGEVDTVTANDVSTFAVAPDGRTMAINEFSTTTGPTNRVCLVAVNGPSRRAP